MNIRKINLNLLQSLDVLLSEKNVTKAAEKYFISQPAMSSNLTKLRDLFEDDLLIKTNNGMVLTPKAESLKPKINEVLRTMQSIVFGAIEFDPSSSNRTFTLGMSDSIEVLLLPKILKIINEQAPYIKINVKHFNYLNSPDDFEDQGLELILGNTIKDSPMLNSELLFNYTGIVVGRENHPLLQKELTKKSYLKADQIKVEYGSNSSDSMLDTFFKEQDIELNYKFVISHAVSILPIIRQTDLIATIPLFINGLILKQLNLSYQPIPYNIPSASAYLTWHKKDDNDTGLIWLKNIIMLATQAMLEQQGL